VRDIFEWLRRTLLWRLPGEATAWDEIFRKRAEVDVLPHERPRIGGKLLDDWALQTICMCPSGGRVIVRRFPDSIRLTVSHPKYIESGASNVVEIRVDPQGEPYLYFDLILFQTEHYPGFGASAFYRAAQAALRAGFSRIDLLAAGGNGYKYTWSRPFNGYYSWARYGFNALLWPATLSRLASNPQLSACKELLDIIDVDPAWWKKHGDGCEMSFALRSTSRSWYTLNRYLAERGLK
jgi:hypothetical protein